MKRSILACLACLLALTLTAAASAHTATAPKASAAAAKPAHKARLPLTGVPTLDRIQASGILRVGVAVNPPWVLHGKDGQLIGYSIDVARRFAADMGWKLELHPTSWPKLLSGLRMNRYDVVISGLSVTPQRALRVRFTRPYGEYDIGLVVNRARLGAGMDDPAKATAGRRIAVLKGTLNVGIARQSLPSAKLVEVDDDQQAIADLRAGKVDGLVAEAPLPGLLAQVYPRQLALSGGHPLGRTAHAMAVRSGDRDLADVLNAWIVQNQAGGWLKAREHYWFEGTGWAPQL